MDETPAGPLKWISVLSVQSIIGIIKALMKICGSKPKVIAPG